MISAYELAAEQCDYPLHLGVTEAGTERMGIIKSAIGIGSLLTRGIGDTIRVSLSDTPVKEVFAAFDILKAIGLKNDSPYLISCPTCDQGGRYGLYRQRPRRGKRGGYRHSRR